MGCYPCGVQSYELFFNITQKSVILFIHGAQSSEFIHGAHSKQSSEFRRNLYGYFLGVASQEILEEIFNKNMACGQKSLWIHGTHGGHGFFIHGAHSKQSSEFKRMFFWILRKI